MTPDETVRLFGLLEASLNRKAPENAVAAWSMVLKDVPYAWARDGALDVLRDTPYWPTPADVYSRARQLADEEMARQKRNQQLALGRTYAPEWEPEPEEPIEKTRGAALVRNLLSAIREANKGEPDRDKRRLNARMVAADFKATHEVAPDRPGLPCTSKTCRCTHTEGCDAGWIEVADDDGNHQAFPCGKCNPRRHTILTSGSTREAAQRALRDTSDVKNQEPDAW